MQHKPGFLKVVQEAKATIKEITIAQYLEDKDAAARYVLIDVREDNEWARGRLPGAVHLGKGVIERDIEVAYPDKDTPLLLYCGGGFRSALAAKSLQQMGYSDVTSLDGGFKGWVKAEQELVTS